ncbi:alpha/beta hydrolase [Bizionia psychrotolerans]|uniref:alpha/beta hydrolase n=1 Tax=Bizionia psychrotolerans TaxID=1492901 RepID=UPI0006521EDA|nr:alpha/beta hydrolase-fold protein [Bizionia psychrotolerans]
MKNILNLCVLAIFTITCLSCESKKKEPESKQSESKYYTDSIFSSSLSEFRKHNVYLPKNFDSNLKYPIIYATDGNNTIENSFYKTLLDSLINHHIIKPVMLIVSHSNSKIADSTSTTTGDGQKVHLQFRNFEYVDRKPTRLEDSMLVNRFNNHMVYFEDELITTIENTFRQKLIKEDRYFYGVSNGAGFGMSLLNTYPNTIGTYICLSTFGGDMQSNLWQENVNYPNLYLQYGSEEPFFLKDDADFLKAKYAELNLFAEVKAFEGGHDYKKWQETFSETIIALFKTE